MSTDKQNTENELAMAILNGLSGPNACKASNINPNRMIPLHIADQAVANCEKEIATLKAEVERLRASSFVTAVPVEEYEKLKAEVERLRKAGDAMASCITEFRCGKYCNALDKVGGFYVWQDWNAAKEGKQS